MNSIRSKVRPIVYKFYKVIYYVLSLLPKQNKVVATTMRGRKYTDSPRFIVEALHKLQPELDIVWLANDKWNYEVPNWLRMVSYYRCASLFRMYEMATAKVWVNSHFIESFIQKKESQLFIETWHASVSLKKICLDLPGYGNHDKDGLMELRNTAMSADVFISNSKSNDDMYKSAFNYEGNIYHCGFPRNDGLVGGAAKAREAVREKLSLQGKKIFLYVPTFRDSFERTGIIDYSPFNVDFEKLYSALNNNLGGDWIILVKFHPIMQNAIDEDKYFTLPYVLNATSYNNMQELICGSDMLLTDYSSAVFDAAIAGIPGFTYCTDYEQYKKDRDFYFEIFDLPFPYASNNDELITNILSFNYEKYYADWERFKESIRLYESGKSSQLIAEKIKEFLKNETIEWK